jgi:hypothetical protein
VKEELSSFYAHIPIKFWFPKSRFEFAKRLAGEHVRSSLSALQGRLAFAAFAIFVVTTVSKPPAAGADEVSNFSVEFISDVVVENARTIAFVTNLGDRRVAVPSFWRVDRIVQQRGRRDRLEALGAALTLRFDPIPGMPTIQKTRLITPAVNLFVEPRETAVVPLSIQGSGLVVGTVLRVRLGLTSETTSKPSSANLKIVKTGPEISSLGLARVQCATPQTAERQTLSGGSWRLTEQGFVPTPEACRSAKDRFNRLVDPTGNVVEYFCSSCGTRKF